MGRRNIILLVVALLASLSSLIGAEEPPAWTWEPHSASRFELKLLPPGASGVTSEPPDASATARLLVRLYALAGPRLGCQLFEPDMVLILAGYGGWLENHYLPGDVHDNSRHLDLLNRILVPRGISLALTRTLRGEEIGWRILNLAGLERVTRASRNQDIEPYHVTTGWDGYYRWWDRKNDILQVHMASGDAPSFVRLFEGTLRGEPPISLMLDRGPDTRLLVDYPNAGAFECTYSQYYVDSSLWHDPAILEDVRRRSDLLGEVYGDAAVTKLTSAPSFQEARRWVLQQVGQDNPDWGFWSDERGRLLLWSPAEWERIRHVRARHLTIGHEQILVGCLSALCQAARGGATADGLLAVCQRAAASQNVCLIDTLREWAYRGRLETAGAHHDFYEAAATGHCGWLTSQTGAVPLSPNPTAMEQYNQGRAAYDHANFKAAKTSFLAALVLDPKFEPAIRGCGECELGLDQTALALAHFQQALTLDPRDARAYVGLAAARASQYSETHVQERLEEAVVAARTAVHLAPNDGGARAQLADLLALQHDNPVWTALRWTRSCHQYHLDQPGQAEGFEAMAVNARGILGLCGTGWWGALNPDGSIRWQYRMVDHGQRTKCLVLSDSSHLLLVDSGAGEDALLMRVDARGHLLWQRRYRGPAGQSLELVDLGEVSASEVALVGSVGRDGCVVHISPADGRVLTAQVARGSGSTFSDVALLPGGGLAMLAPAGTYNDRTGFTLVDLRLVCMNAQGQTAWSVSLPSPGKAEKSALSTYRLSGNGRDLYVLRPQGSYSLVDHVDAEGHLDWEERVLFPVKTILFPTLGPDGLLATPDGCLLVLDDRNFDVETNAGLLAVSIDSHGKTVWSHKYPGRGSYDVACGVSTAGGAVLGGSGNGLSSVTLKIDTGGRLDGQESRTTVASRSVPTTHALKHPAYRFTPLSVHADPASIRLTPATARQIH